MPKIWRSPIFKKNSFPVKNAGKTGFLTFSRNFIINFFWFFAQICVLAMSKTWPRAIFQKNSFPAENAGNMPEIAVFADFHRTFSYNISLFFHRKTLLTTMPTIKHGSIVNKTDFCNRNYLKIAGTADFRRKNGISWISRAVRYIFSWNFAHWCKMAMSKMWQSLIFEKHIFPAENAGNMPEKPVFWHFLEISLYVFPGSLHKNAY